MKKVLLFSSLAYIILGLASISSKSNEVSGHVFSGEGENWIGEFITTYDSKGDERHRILLKYKGEKPEELKETDIVLESSDFLGWGIGNISLDKNGSYDSGIVAEVENQTPSTSQILLTIQGEEAEIIRLVSN